MQKKVIITGIALTIVIAGILIFMRTRHTSVPAHQSPQNDTIVAFGDSLVAGYGASEGHDFVSDLGGLLGKIIINKGKNGDTTAGALGRVESIIALDPGTVILLIGGNDILRSVPIATTEANIRSIVKQLQTNGTRVVLIGVRGAVLHDPYGPMYRSIAEDYSLSYVPDILGGLIGHDEYMSDVIHPNDVGYARIAQRIYDEAFEK